MLNQIPSSISFMRQEQKEYCSKIKIDSQLIFSMRRNDFNGIKYQVGSIDSESREYSIRGYIAQDSKNYYGEDWNFYTDRELTNLSESAYTLKNLKVKISESIY